MERQRIASGTEWESRVGYSGAVRVGDRVLVSGTTAMDEDGEVVGGTPAERTERALSNVERVLGGAGAELADVVRTRVYVTDIDDWEAVGEVHGEFFGGARPAATMVEASALVDPELVVEVECEAVVSD